MAKARCQDAEEDEEAEEKEKEKERGTASEHQGEEDEVAKVLKQDQLLSSLTHAHSTSIKKYYFPFPGSPAYRDHTRSHTSGCVLEEAME